MARCLPVLLQFGGSMTKRLELRLFLAASKIVLHGLVVAAPAGRVAPAR